LNVHADGKGGAPESGGLAPAVYVVAGPKVGRVGIPELITVSGGIPVYVAGGGGPVATGAAGVVVELKPGGVIAGVLDVVITLSEVT